MNQFPHPSVFVSVCNTHGGAEHSYNSLLASYMRLYEAHHQQGTDKEGSDFAGPMVAVPTVPHDEEVSRLLWEACRIQHFRIKVLTHALANEIGHEKARQVVANSASFVYYMQHISEENHECVDPELIVNEQEELLSVIQGSLL